MRTRTLALIFALAAAAGCNTTANPGGARIEGPSLTLGDSHTDSSSGTFCPPGQAKKGRC